MLLYEEVVEANHCLLCTQFLFSHSVNITHEFVQQLADRCNGFM